MSKYRVTGPDGTQYDVQAPDDASEDDVIGHVQQQHGKPGWASRIASGVAGAIPGFGLGAGLLTGTETGRNVLSGGLQGAVLDPLEGVGQLVEHLTGAKLAPDFIRDKLKSFRSGVESTTAGEVGRIGGAVGSMFIPGGGEAALAARAASEARAGGAGLMAVRSALGPDRAGPAGYAAVRRALETPGEIGTKAVAREMRRPENVAGKPLYTTVEDYFPKQGTASRASEAAAARRQTVPPPLPVGAPTAAERARLFMHDIPANAASFAQRWPGTTSTLAGAGRAAAQPVEGGDNYAGQKAAQMFAGGLAPAIVGTPWGRQTLSHLASHGAVVVPAGVAATAAHAMGIPHEALYAVGAAGGVPLWRLARQAHHRIGRPIERALRRARRKTPVWAGTGAVAGQAVGRSQQEDDE
ncbi:MAG TPA: hypothetical protein VHT52_14170 [Stellaceae bacterium]|jgi:hypothetical protein|nr:hypothetical protein [Stellaceae bacterium]